jgi:hypothetical protein
VTTHESRPISHHIRTRLGRFPRALVVILALTLAAILALSVHRGIPSRGYAASPLIGLADVHVYVGGAKSELEINVDITQTRNDCGAPLNGQICLRYSVTEDDQPIEAGVGLIPATAVKTSGATVKLSTNTASNPNIHRSAGGGGVIGITWTPSASGRPVTAHHWTTTLVPSAAHGTVVGHPLAGKEKHSSLLTVISRS